MSNYKTFAGAVKVQVPADNTENIFLVEPVKKLLVNAEDAGAGQLFITEGRLVFVQEPTKQENGYEYCDCPGTRGMGIEVSFVALTNFHFLMEDAISSTHPAGPPRIIIDCKGERDSEGAFGKDECVFILSSNAAVEKCYEALITRTEKVKGKDVQNETFVVHFGDDLTSRKKCSMCKYIHISKCKY